MEFLSSGFSYDEITKILERYEQEIPEPFSNG
jgi:hypothetical protein